MSHQLPNEFGTFYRCRHLPGSEDSLKTCLNDFFKRLKWISSVIKRPVKSYTHWICTFYKPYTVIFINSPIRIQDSENNSIAANILAQSDILFHNFQFI